jgi:hypothetical protein
MAAGLLHREPHPGDRRLVRLMLTERGHSLEGVIAAETDKLTERVLASFIGLPYLAFSFSPACRGESEKRSDTSRRSKCRPEQS